MGDYNPTWPGIVGMEWVPIRAEPYPLTPDEEVGVSFQATATDLITLGAFVLTTMPPQATNQVPLIAVYQQGREAAGGPARQVDIPVSGGTLAGGASLLSTDNVADALDRPSDWGGVLLPTYGATVDLTFAMGTAMVLAGNRILNVELLYVATTSTVSQPPPGLGLSAGIRLGTNPAWLYGAMTAATSSATTTVASLMLGDINPFLNGYPQNSVVDRWPWTYPQLQRLAAGNADPLVLRIFGGENVTLQYAALRVTYCDETRLAVGGITATGTTSGYHPGVNLITLRDPVSLNTGVTIGPGQYLATITLARSGPSSLLGPRAILPRLRQLYPAPPQRGVVITKALTAGASAVATDTDALTPVVVFTGNGVLPGCHGYTEQIAAPVYGTTTAAQGLPAGAPATTYRIVRFYARRLGATTAALTIRNVADPTQAVSISPTQLDTLPEIIDGWREVTLPLPSPGAPLATASTWEWLSPGEVAANRWEILATRTVPSGVPATHGGNTVNLTWDDPATPGGAGADPTADAVLLFFAPPPPVTGLTVTETIQALAGLDPACGVPARGIPTGIRTHQLTWTPPQSDPARDTFTRTTTNGWGAADTGQAWTTSGGAAGDYATAAGAGTHTLTADSVGHLSVLAVAEAHVRVRCTLTTPVLITAVTVEAGILMRYTDPSNHLRCVVDLNADQSIGLRIIQTTAGTATTLGALPSVAGLSHVANQPIALCAETEGRWVRMRAWPASGTEPDGWQLQAPTTITPAGQVGIRTARLVGNTNTNLPIACRNLTVTRLAPGFGTLQVQRADDLDPTWHTIMQTSTPTVATFTDHEARIGVRSRYRIRSCDRLGGCGDWSAEATHTLTAPGVTGTTSSGVLVFTSNHRQNGAGNLAHPTVHDHAPTRELAFPETDTITVQRLHGRDYQTVFHGAERGGEHFTTTLLIQATATNPPVRLRTLRDLAWADLPYVCVRDATGQRWLAAITVPAATITGRRGIHLAQVDILEVTDTPSPVDPANR